MTQSGRGNAAFRSGRDELPIFYFLAGVEGAGHDFFERFFGYLPANISFVRFEPDLHLTWDEHQKVDSTRPEGLEECPLMPYTRHAHDFGMQMAARLQSQVGSNGLYFRARDPFPMGRVRTPLARPDLTSLALFDGVLYNLKVLAIVRNASKAVAWSVERNFHADDVGLQVRLIEDSLVYLDASLRMLPCSSYAAIDFEMLVTHPEQISRQLSRFLAAPTVGEDDVRRALKSARSAWVAPPDDLLPEFSGASVDTFFDARAGMWPLMTACSRVPFFSPSSPSSWPSPS
eukprot:jgi/Mesen1/6929/ME000036S06257